MNNIKLTPEEENEINKLLDHAESDLPEIIKKLRVIFLEGFGKQSNIKEKTPGDFVTSSDKKIEKLFKQWINKNYPDHTVYGEEDDEPNNRQLPTWLWAIDPIDGTNNYQFGNTECSIVISLRYKGTPVLALCDMPAKNCGKEWSYFARYEKGTFVNGKRSFSSKISKLKYATLIFTKLDFPERMMMMVKDIWDKGAAVHLNMASVSEACKIASGEIGVGVFFEAGPHEWPAMYLIAKESGCVVGLLDNPNILDIDMNKIDLKNFVIAANKSLYDEAKKLVHLPPVKSEYIKELKSTTKQT